MTNEELLLAYQSGDEAAFTALVENCLPFAYRYAQRELSDHQQAEDVCQLVFSSLAGLSKRADEIRSVSAWVFSCTRRQIALMIRKESRRRRREQVAAELGHARPEQSQDGIDLEAVTPALRASLAELPPRDQDALFLRFYEGQSFRQLGNSLGIREHAAQKRVQRAMDRLQGLLNTRGITSVASLLGAQIFTAGAAEFPQELAQSIAAQALRNPTAPASSSVVTILTSIAIPGVAAIAITMLVGWILVSNRPASRDDSPTMASAGTSPPSLLANTATVLSSNGTGLAIDDIEGIYQLTPDRREEALAKLTHYLRERGDADYLSDLFRRWTTLDPRRNAEALVSLIRDAGSGSERQAFLATLLDIPLHRWSSQTLNEAREWVMNLQRTDYAEAYAHESLLRFLAVHDLDAAYTVLTSRGNVRTETITILVPPLMEKPLAETLHLLDNWERDRPQLAASERDRELTFRHATGETKQALLELVLPELYERDPEAIARWIGEQPSADLLRRSLLAAWAKNNPENACHWALESSENDQAMLGIAFSHWLDHAADNAPLRWLEAHAEVLDSPELFDKAAARLQAQTALAWADSLPNPAQKAAVRRQAFYLFGQDQPSKGRALLESQAPLDTRAAEAFAWGAFVSQGRRYLTDWRQNLDSNSALFTAITAAEIDLIAALRPSLAYRLTKTLPRGSTRDHAAANLLKRTMHRSIDDADTAATWATEFFSGSQREDYKQTIAAAKKALALLPAGTALPQISNTSFSKQPLADLEARLNTLSTIPSSMLER